MARTVTLIRHAKSSWSNPSLTDFQRPLNQRGMGDAPRIASALAEHDISFARVICSDARRARQTLALFARQLAIDESCIEYSHGLYGASAQQLLSCLTTLPDSVSDIALLGHNPGMEELAQLLSNTPIASMPTCCVLQLLFECASWHELPLAPGSAVLFLKPRDL